MSIDAPTSLLFGLGSFRVVDVRRAADGLVQVVMETVETQGFCPDCGQASSRVKDRPVVRINRFGGEVDRRQLLASALLVDQGLVGCGVEDVDCVDVVPAHADQRRAGDVDSGQARHDGSSVRVPAVVAQHRHSRRDQFGSDRETPRAG
jgi:hypothetical protein